MTDLSQDSTPGGQPAFLPYMYYRQPHPLLIVISGPSGVGKDVTVAAMKEMGLPFHFVVTATTRPPRPGEVHGVDYFFYSPQEFEQMIAAGELLEYAWVYGQYKGIPKQQVQAALDSGQDVVMRLDVQGAATIRGKVPDAVLMFLVASSDAELEQRLRGRNTESDASLQLRLDTARQEMARVDEFDYVIVNRHCRLQETVEQIHAIICAEKCRVVQRCISL